MNQDQPPHTDGFHARELIELASLVATQGSGLMTGAGRIPGASMEQYWRASKCRLDQWGRALKQYREETNTLDSFTLGQRWVVKRPLFEELFTSEALTRVWAAAIAGYDQSVGQQQFEPLTRSVMQGHAEIRNRAMALLASGAGVSVRDAVALNRLRRRIERWTDLLVARLMQSADVGEYAADRDRASDFARDLREQSGHESRRNAWNLAMASLRAAFSYGLSLNSPSSDLNRQIAEAVTACFQPELFDSTGTFHSLWMVRMIHNSQDAEGLIESVLSPVVPEPIPGPNRLVEGLDAP